MKTALLRIALLLAAGLTARAADAPPPAAPPAPPASVEDTYTLNVQDKLLYAVREDPIKGAAPDEVAVTAQGELHFRVSRGADDFLTVLARGKTVAQVREELKARLDADFYHHATVDLRLKEQVRRPGQVLFFGAVRSNFLPLAPGETKTIFEGVYQVGVDQFANLKKVKLVRANPKTGKTDTFLVNLEAIKRGDRSQDLTLQDGDRVEVPEKSIVF